MSESVSTLFLELLRSAVWNKPANKDLFQGIGQSEWRKILYWASTQKVDALIYDAIQTLPETLHPERKLLYKLFLHTEAIEKTNERVNEVLKQLSQHYKDIDCPFVLLKGQSHGILYPNPKHRTPGDIDAFLYRKDDYKKANEWAKAQRFKMEEENPKHQGFVLQGIHVENHRYVIHFNRKKYNSQVEDEVRRILDNNQLVPLMLNDLKVLTLPPAFNAFFIFQHLFHHFLDGGVGFRQFIDWVLFLNAHIEQISKDEFTVLAEKFHLLKPMQVFAHVAVKALNAPSSIFPFELGQDSRFSEIVLQDILISGNFGNYRDYQRPIGKWSGRWSSFVFTIKRAIQFAPMSSEHTLILPYWKLMRRIRLTFGKNKKTWVD